MNVRALRMDVLFVWVLVCLDRSRASCLCVNARARVCVRVCMRACACAFAVMCALECG